MVDRSIPYSTPHAAQPVRIEEESPAKAQATAQATAQASLVAEVEAEAESKVAGLAARPEVCACIYALPLQTPPNHPI